jgi:hypothetical protein
VGTCGTYGRKERCIQGLSGEKQKERDHFGDLGMDWINLAQIRDKWQAVVITEMKL